MVLRQCLKSRTDVVKLIDFAQDRFKSHAYRFAVSVSLIDLPNDTRPESRNLSGFDPSYARGTQPQGWMIRRASREERR
jgi:hypothetical protein